MRVSALRPLKAVLQSTSTSRKAAFNGFRSFSSSSNSYQQQQQRQNKYGRYGFAFAVASAVGVSVGVGLAAAKETDVAAAKGTDDGEWAVFSRKEIEGHNTEAKRVWIVVGEGVYDMTDFIGSHPGGKEKVHHTTFPPHPYHGYSRTDVCCVFVFRL